MTFMNRAALAALVAVSLAVPAAAQQSSITQADIQRLQDNVFLAERDLNQIQNRDSARVSQMRRSPTSTERSASIPATRPRSTTSSSP